MKYGVLDIFNTAVFLGVSFHDFRMSDLVTGVDIEMEYGLVNPETNVTNDNLVMTMKIALAHLNEFPNYYNREYGLPALERDLQEKMKRL